jgi:hypothetical protein
MKAITTQEAPLVDRLFGWWYRIAIPPEVPDDAPLRDRMRVRSGKLTGMIILFEMLIALVTLIVVIIEKNTFDAPVIGVCLITLIIGVVLNRQGKTTAAGILVIILEEIGVIVSILGVGNVRIPVDSASLIDFDFFIGADLIAASMLAPWVTFPLTLGNCFITAAIITFAYKSPDLIRDLSTRAFYIYAYPIETQLLVATVCFLWASSTYREMRRASNAEEVNNLTMALVKQQQTEDLRKRQLEESIQQILSVHIKFANGNWHARVSLSQQNVLWPLAGSLNNLLARLQSWRYDAIQLQRNEQAIHQLLQNIQRAKREKKSIRAYKTGTPLDVVIQEISKGIAGPQQTSGLSSGYHHLHTVIDPRREGP